MMLCFAGGFLGLLFGNSSALGGFGDFAFGIWFLLGLVSC